MRFNLNMGRRAARSGPALAETLDGVLSPTDTASRKARADPTEPGDDLGHRVAERWIPADSAATRRSRRRRGRSLTRWCVRHGPVPARWGISGPTGPGPNRNDVELKLRFSLNCY